ncbi:hypothetical protein N7462_009794 [Penicillium macrosclerotiorum]|uniref:uncharacterized protein n=1 Tax=Penicillium macrosclerotiorum TaxID=303699 RepID=UPI0025470E90|nr:uncharacterized protein N7462_009794 [Penicillium macrosclerotiorum]KAJ5668724.1 hypothetical protein N7462_009794 [Penicillium macrosclerotiorum]
MDFLRLEVKVLLPDQQPDVRSQGTSSSLMNTGIPSIENVQEQPTVVRPTASFLLLVKEPEKTTVAELCAMISSEWDELHPDEPLDIKKILNDARPHVDLNLRWPVSDIFMDLGVKARGHLQEGVVRVIQKPSTHRRERFSSVVHDYKGASREETRNARITTSKLPFIAEASEPDALVVPGNQIAEVDVRRDKTENRSRKRKQTPELETAHKIARLQDPPAEQSISLRSPERVHGPGPQRYMSRALSPEQRRASQPKSNTSGLGLGITASPSSKRNRTAMADPISSSQAVSREAKRVMDDRQSSTASSAGQVNGMASANLTPMDKQHVQEIRDLLAHPETVNINCLPIFHDLLEIYSDIEARDPKTRDSRKSADMRNLRKKLSRRRQNLRNLGFEFKEHRNDSPTEPALPVSDTKISRRIPPQKGPATPTGVSRPPVQGHHSRSTPSVVIPVLPTEAAEPKVSNKKPSDDKSEPEEEDDGEGQDKNSIREEEQASATKSKDHDVKIKNLNPAEAASGDEDVEDEEEDEEEEEEGGGRR